jgi:universal stress protein E
MNGGQLLAINFASLPEPALLQRATDLSRALGQELNVCCLIDDASVPTVLPGRRARLRRLRKKRIARCRGALDNVVRQARAQGVVAHTEVRSVTSLEGAALELTRKLAPSFVLICRSRHTRLEEATLSGSDFAVIRGCPVPVWVVNPERRSGNKIVGAIERADSTGEGTSLDENILEKASHLARKLGKEPHVLHTFGQAGLPQSLELPMRDPEDDMGASRYDRRMRRIFDFGNAHGLPPERVHIHEGKLVDTLEEMSGTMNADLIIIGARRRSRLNRLFSGSAAERVVQRVETDVLVVKGDGARHQPGLFL